MDITSTTLIFFPLLSEISLKVSTAMACWDCLEVMKSTRPPVLRASSTAGDRAAAVLPMPVGTEAIRMRPLEIASATSSWNSSCPGLMVSKGNIPGAGAPDPARALLAFTPPPLSSPSPSRMWSRSDLLVPSLDCGATPFLTFGMDVPSFS